MKDKNGEPAWDDALVGFVSGADPIWQQYYYLFAERACFRLG